MRAIKEFLMGLTFGDLLIILALVLLFFMAAGPRTCELALDLNSKQVAHTLK